jgi:Xaa-Pro aminopeptidase
MVFSTGTRQERDYMNRIGGLQNLMLEKGMDAAVIGPTTAMVYLLGDRPHPDERLCLLLVSPDQVQMLVSILNADTVRSFSDAELLTWMDEEGPEMALRSSLLASRDIEKIAVDGAMRAQFLMALLSLKADGQFLPIDGLMATLRMRKSGEEIEALQRAAAQADEAMSAAVEACRPGTTEAEIAWEAEKAFRASRAEKVEFTIVASGPNASLPHHNSGEKPLRQGEGIIIDIGASLKGYKSDITRVVHLGKPSEEFARVFDLVAEANKAGRSAVRAGASAGSVDAAARKVIEDAGYGDRFIHRTGHGIGLDVHEEPWIMQGSELLLEEGMVFSVEPGIYVPGTLGVRIEDIVAVTESGACILTGFDHGLVIR